MAIVLTELQHKQIEANSVTKLQAFQRKIYLKAKQNKDYKFYCLYDKVFRRDTLEEAYKRVKANKWTWWVDGIEFKDLENKETEFIDEIQKELKENIYKPQKLKEVEIPKSNWKKRKLRIPTIKDRVVQMALKIIIEPIFEADFEDNSYWYRPKKSAHEAIGNIQKELFREVYKEEENRKTIYSIDLSDCFNTIPHKELLNVIAKRIIDRKVLHLIKMMIEVWRDKEKEKDWKGKRWTPQWWVISPLLANIYLDKLDKYWKIQTKYSKMYRYADDTVIILHKNEENKFQQFLEYIWNEMKLTVNKDKTEISQVDKWINYLGFTMMEKMSRNNKKYLSVEPSKKAMNKVKETLRNKIKSNNSISTKEMIEYTNKVLKWWQQYFDNICMWKTRNQINTFVELRVAKMISKRNKRNGITWKLFENNKLNTKYGLYKMINLNRRFA